MKPGKYHEGLQRSLEQCQQQWRRSPLYNQRLGRDFKSIANTGNVITPALEKRQKTFFIYEKLGLNSCYEVEAAEILSRFKKT